MGGVVVTGQSTGRWRWVIGGVAAVLAVVWVTYVGAVDSLRGTAPVSGEMAGIPERIDSPWDWTPSVAQQPIGPAGLIIGGSVGALRTPATDRAPWIEGIETNKELGTAAFLAGAGEAYRLLTFESFGMQIPGEQLLLSPDGRQAAYTDQLTESVVLIDGTTGRVRSVLTDGDMEENYPLAWSPDGSSLIVGKRHRNVSSDIAEWYHELFLVDLVSGKMVPLLTGEFPVEQPALGFVAAFAPDGSRVAVQMDQEIAIVGTDGRRQATFPAIRGGRLAGKGAWTPDGKSLMLLTGTGRRWHLERIDAATGSVRAGQALPEVPEVTALRLLGWWPDGRALVVAYRPGPHAGQEDFSFDDTLRKPTRREWVRAIEVLALGADGTTTTVLRAPDEQRRVA
jgi:hypothetical protein